MKVWSTAKGGRLSLPPQRAQGNTSSQLRSITMRPASTRRLHNKAGGVYVLALWSQADTGP